MEQVLGDHVADENLDRLVVAENAWREPVE
jgi:hypothetical protein